MSLTKEKCKHQKVGIKHMIGTKNQNHQILNILVQMEIAVQRTLKTENELYIIIIYNNKSDFVLNIIFKFQN